MKKNIKLTALFLTVWALLAGSLSAENLNITSVNMRMLFSKYYRLPIEAAEFVKEAERAKEEDGVTVKLLQEMGDELAVMKKEMEASTTSKKEKAELAQQYQIKLKEGQQKNKQRIAAYERRIRAIESDQKEALSSMSEEIVEMVAKYSEDKGYDLVFNKSAGTNNGLSSLLYNKTTGDITDEVLKFLNDKAPAEKATE